LSARVVPDSTEGTSVTMLLTAIANDEGSDKGTRGPVEEWPGHNYTDIYEAYLGRVRNEPITLLEIGLGVDGPNWRALIAQGRNAQGGASIRMWYRYLSAALILGVDVNPARFLDNDRIRTGVADAGDPVQLQAFLASANVETLDVVIDDGSHRPHHQQTALAVLFPYLVPGGLYFIEDLMSNGADDDQTSDQSDQGALNTRHVLRNFAETGTFPQPHALGDDTTLGAMIDSVTFHVPRVTLAASRRWALPYRRMRVHHVTDEPTLCAIRRIGP
jgi:hypothetical protein